MEVEQRTFHFRRLSALRRRGETRRGTSESSRPGPSDHRGIVKGRTGFGRELTRGLKERGGGE